jgi:hypothetical protein
MFTPKPPNVACDTVLAILEANTVSQATLGGLGVWCLMPLPTIFQIYRGSQFYWWRKSEYTEMTIDLS